MQVGGVDQLLELVETGVGITEHKTRSYPLAIYYGEDDLPEVGFSCCGALPWTQATATGSKAATTPGFLLRGLATLLLPGVYSQRNVSICKYSDHLVCLCICTSGQCTICASHYVTE